MPEVLLRSSFNTEYSFTGLGDIEIYLHYPLLTPEQFDKDGIICLEALSPPTVPAECKTVLSHLLTDCTASTYFLTLGLMLFLHLDELLKIKTPMLHETPIFGSHDRSNHDR